MKFKDCTPGKFYLVHYYGTGEYIFECTKISSDALTGIYRQYYNVGVEFSRYINIHDEVNILKISEVTKELNPEHFL